MSLVALTYNLIHEQEIGNNPIDFIAEYDNPETITAMKNAIEACGHEVLLVEADEEAYFTLHKYKNTIDMVFNIAEGIQGESRESFIPAILEMLGIPYVGSGPLSLALCLDKVRTKEILLQHDIPTPKFQEILSPAEVVNPQLTYPMIVKLAREGSSMGIDYDSVVDNEKELTEKVHFLFQTYNRPVIIEEFIDGQEFGIPLIGNLSPITLPIIEFKFHGEKPITIFVPDKPLSIFKQREYAMPESNVTNICPAEISESLEFILNSLAVKAFKALGCKDWCRLEIRLDKSGNPFVIELNPIPGIDPSYRFAFSAGKAGMDFNTLINKILNFAFQRYTQGKISE